MAVQEVPIGPIFMDTIYASFHASSNAEAGYQLGLSSSTIIDRFSLLRRKTDEQETIGVLLLARESGILDPIKELGLDKKAVEAVMDDLRTKPKFKNAFDIAKTRIRERSLYSIRGERPKGNLEAAENSLVSAFGVRTLPQALLLVDSMLTSLERTELQNTQDKGTLRRLVFRGEYTYEPKEKIDAYTVVPEEQSKIAEKPVVIFGKEKPLKSLDAFLNAEDGRMVIAFSRTRQELSNQSIRSHPRLLVTTNNLDTLLKWSHKYLPQLYRAYEDLEPGEIIKEDETGGVIFLEPHCLEDDFIRDLVVELLDTFGLSRRVKSQVLQKLDSETI